MQKMKKEVPVADTIKPHPTIQFKVKHTKNNITYTVKGINYYPKNSAWDLLFNIDTIAKTLTSSSKCKT
jgi:hypothetical protein